MSRRSDEDSLRDLFDAARGAVSFVQGRQRSDLDEDKKLVLTIVRLVEGGRPKGYITDPPRMAPSAKDAG